MARPKKSEDKIINVRDYAVEHGLLDNSNKSGSLVAALNAIDRTYGIVDVWSLGEIMVVRIK